MEISFYFSNAFIGDKLALKLENLSLIKTHYLFSIISRGDDANRRVFKSAKVSVCIAYCKKITNDYNFDWEV